MVEVWVKPGGGKTRTGGEDASAWRLLKSWEFELSQLRRWDGKVSPFYLVPLHAQPASDVRSTKSRLPPNTLLMSFASQPSELLYLPTQSSIVRPRRPSLERTLSDGEVDGPKSRRARLAKEWSGARDVVERSLRETRMKRGIGFGELHRCVHHPVHSRAFERSS